MLPLCISPMWLHICMGLAVSEFGATLDEVGGILCGILRNEEMDGWGSARSI